MDEKTTVAELTARIAKIRQDRAWEKYHTPKDLTLAAMVELGEVMEHLRFKTDDEIRAYLSDPEHKKEFSHELMDVLAFILSMCDMESIDVSSSFFEKMDLVDKKYPAEDFKGKITSREVKQELKNGNKDE